MGDLRLLAPTAVAWATGWLVVGAPDVGVDPGAIAVALWAAGVPVLVMLLVGRRWAASGVLTGIGAPVLVALAAAGLVAGSAAAGGFTVDADPAAVNLARPLVDGEQLVVLAIGQVTDPTAGTPGAGAGAGAADAPAGDGLVHLNTADVAELDTLPRIGPALAQRIIDWREANGPFTSVDQLLEVAGIGDAVFSGLAELVAP